MIYLIPSWTLTDFSRSLILKKHFSSFGEEETAVGIDDTGESPPSPISFNEVCALNDLIELSDESDPPPVDPTDSKDKLTIKFRSDFYPVASRGKDLYLFQKLVDGDLTRLAHNCHKRPIKDNLTQNERLALKTLTADTSIAIRNADKGGIVVVLDTETYTQEALHQLSDTQTYQLLLLKTNSLPF